MNVEQINSFDCLTGIVLVLAFFSEFFWIVLNSMIATNHDKKTSQTIKRKFKLIKIISRIFFISLLGILIQQGCFQIFGKITLGILLFIIFFSTIMVVYCRLIDFKRNQNQSHPN